MKRPQLDKQKRKDLFIEIAELAREIQNKVNYLAISDKAEQVGCGCLEISDRKYFSKLALEIDEHAIGSIYHYDLHKEVE